MSTPHDFLGRELEAGQLVVVADSEPSRHLRLGLVDRVLTDTGCVDVKTVVLGRVPEIEVERFAFPANQLLTMGWDGLNHHNPYHKRLIQLINEAIST